MNSICSTHSTFDERFSPYLVRDGVFGATFHNGEEPLFLRMELLNKENSKNWTEFRNASCRTCQPNRGVLSVLLDLAGTDEYPSYEEAKEVTGFTIEEFAELTQKAINLKRTTDKIVRVMNSNSAGTIALATHGKPQDSRYIVYASKNPDFSIQETKISGTYTLKKYIEAYSDILITMGSDFSNKDIFSIIFYEDSFSNRGISRNPYWVFEGKYSGLSMLLHGFTGAVASKYFSEEETVTRLTSVSPTGVEPASEDLDTPANSSLKVSPVAKKFMRVSPLGSMQCILKKSILRGEGYFRDNQGKTTDLCDIEVSPYDSQCYGNDYITVSALTRIYNQKMMDGFLSAGSKEEAK